jgi:hypothetical protein
MCTVLLPPGVNSISVKINKYKYTYTRIFPQCHHMSLIDFMVSPPGCGRSVTDLWGWDAHEARLRMVIYGYEVPGEALNLSSTKLLRPWSPWGSSTSRKNPHGRTGNRTRHLMLSSQNPRPLDHEAGHILVHTNTLQKSKILLVSVSLYVLFCGRFYKSYLKLGTYFAFSWRKYKYVCLLCQLLHHYLMEINVYKKFDTPTRKNKICLRENLKKSAIKFMRQNNFFSISFCRFTQPNAHTVD